MVATGTPVLCVAIISGLATGLDQSITSKFLATLVDARGWLYLLWAEGQRKKSIFCLTNLHSMTPRVEQAPQNGPSQHLSRITIWATCSNTFQRVSPWIQLSHITILTFPHWMLKKKGCGFLSIETLKLVLRHTKLLLGGQLYSGSAVQSYQLHWFRLSRRQ